MKTFKWIAVVSAGAIVALVVALEGSYLYHSRNMTPERLESQLVVPQTALDALWVSVGERGEIALERTSATGYVLAFVRTAVVDDPADSQTHVGKGWLVANQAQRLLSVPHRSRAIQRHFDAALTLVWLTRNTDAAALMRFVLEKSYFGHGAYGIEAAAMTYFNTPASRLGFDEIIGLVAILASPSRFDPYCSKERFVSRTNQLIGSLQENWPERYGAQGFSMPGLVERHEDICS